MSLEVHDRHSEALFEVLWCPVCGHEVFSHIPYEGVVCKNCNTQVVHLDDMIELAEGTGVPHATVLVPMASLLLLVGGILRALGIAPMLGVIAIATFLPGVTPEMHDFWQEIGEERSEEFDAFVRYIAFLGATVAFWLVSRGRDQPSTNESAFEESC